MPVVDDVDALRERESRSKIPLDQDGRLSGIDKIRARFHQIPDDYRGEPFEWFIGFIRRMAAVRVVTFTSTAGTPRTSSRMVRGLATTSHRTGVARRR
jgi:hypothetical protein